MPKIKDSHVTFCSTVVVKSLQKKTKLSLGMGQKKKYDSRCFVLELVPVRGDNISTHAHKTGSSYLLGTGQ